jgi:hypothetical protein
VRDLNRHSSAAPTAGSISNFSHPEIGCYQYDTTGHGGHQVLSKKPARMRALRNIDYAIADLIKRDGRIVGARGVDSTTARLSPPRAADHPGPAAAADCSTSTTTRRK